jgi:hypothetical protein
MTKNQLICLAFFIITSWLMPSSVQAMNSFTDKKPEFYLAVMATNKSRATLLERTDEMGIQSYVITWKSKVDVKNRLIKNVKIREGGQWHRLLEAPWPDALYDIGVYKGQKRKKNVADAVKKQLSDEGVPFINHDQAMTAVNNKLVFANLMRKNKIAHPHTVDLDTSARQFLTFRQDNLSRMIGMYGQLFLKPALGSKGYGIIIVDSQGDGLYSVRYKTRDQNDNKKWNINLIQGLSLDQVGEGVAEARAAMRTGRAPYIIQNGIDVLRYADQQTDFRVNIQRGEGGELKCTGFMVRVGGNLSQGGRPADYRIVMLELANRLEKDVDELMNGVKEVALRTHEALENKAGIKIGDLGMDVVIDNNGHAFIIEANTKSGYPSVYVEKNLGLEKLYGLPPALKICKEKDAQHEINLIEYARFLTGKKREGHTCILIPRKTCKACRRQD